MCWVLQGHALDPLIKLELSAQLEDGVLRPFPPFLSPSWRCRLMIVLVAHVDPRAKDQMPTSGEDSLSDHDWNGVVLGGYEGVSVRWLAFQLVVDLQDILHTQLVQESNNKSITSTG